MSIVQSNQTWKAHATFLVNSQLDGIPITKSHQSVRKAIQGLGYVLRGEDTSSQKHFSSGLKDRLATLASYMTDANLYVPKNSKNVNKEIETFKKIVLSRVQAAIHQLKPLLRHADMRLKRSEEQQVEAQKNKAEQELLRKAQSAQTSSSNRVLARFLRSDSIDQSFFLGHSYVKFICSNLRERQKIIQETPMLKRAINLGVEERDLIQILEILCQGIGTEFLPGMADLFDEGVSLDEIYNLDGALQHEVIKNAGGVAKMLSHGETLEKLIDFQPHVRSFVLNHANSFALLKEVGVEIEEVLKVPKPFRNTILHNTLSIAALIRVGVNFKELVNIPDINKRNTLASAEYELSYVLYYSKLGLNDLLSLSFEKLRAVCHNSEALSELAQKGVPLQSFLELEDSLCLKCLSNARDILNLSSLGITFEMLREVKEPRRRHIINFASEVFALITSGVDFEQIVTIPQTVFEAVFSSHVSIISIILSGTKFQEILDLKEPFKSIFWQDPSKFVESLEEGASLKAIAQLYLPLKVYT